MGPAGRGGNFGIVTEFEFATHPFGPVAVAGFVVYRLDDGPAVLRGYRQFAAAAPEEVTTIVVLRHARRHRGFPLTSAASRWS